MQLSVQLGGCLSLASLLFMVVGSVGLATDARTVKNVHWAKYDLALRPSQEFAGALGAEVYMTIAAIRIDAAAFDSQNENHT